MSVKASSPLTSNETKQLMLFCGYGTLSAPIWFLGIEESLGKRAGEPNALPTAELRVRAGWQPVMSVRVAHEQLDDPYWERKDYSSVWRVMAQLTLAIALNGLDWRDAGLVHRYVIERLGHKGGETFLGDLFPLPALSVGRWPYGELVSSRAEYEERIWPLRQEMWSSLLKTHNPRWVICYGKGTREAHWDRYKEIFACDEWDTVVEDRVLSCQRSNGSMAILAPFFGVGQYRLTDLEAIVKVCKGVS